MRYIVFLLSFAFTTIIYSQSRSEIRNEIINSFLENEEKGEYVQFLMDGGLTIEELDKIVEILVMRELIKNEVGTSYFKSKYVKTEYRTCKDIANYRCSTMVSQPILQLSVHQQVYQIMNKINSTKGWMTADFDGEEWYDYSNNGHLVSELRYFIRLWEDEEFYYTKYYDQMRAASECRLCQNREGE